MQNLLIIAEKSSFLTLSMAEQLKGLGYHTVISELDIRKIAEQVENFEAVLLSMESDVSEKTQELVYLRDKAVEEDLPVFYMGEDEENLRDIMPSHILRQVFERPIDVQVCARDIDRYIKEHGKHIRKKVLVVDDSGAVLRNVKGWLEDKYQVILANSGAMAIKYLATNRPDLVLLDYEMPVVNGRQVLEMIRTETEFCDMPVIFLTSKNDRASIMEVMQLKPEGYLLKSMEPQQIVQAVDDFFAKRTTRL